MDRRNFIKLIGVGAAVVAVPINILAAGKNPDCLVSDHQPYHMTNSSSNKRKVKKFVISNEDDKGFVSAEWEEVEMKIIKKDDVFRTYRANGSLMEWEGDTAFFATGDAYQNKWFKDQEVWEVAGKGLKKTLKEKYLWIEIGPRVAGKLALHQ